MVERIIENEKKFDEVISVVNNLELSLNSFENIKETIEDLNKYYGSNEWFIDKENIENGKIDNVKNGILSEDGFWNVYVDIKEIAKRMNKISNEILNNRND